MCVCPDGMAGDPTSGCAGPECRVDDECPLHLACMGYRCRDPCPGSCGAGASCRVEKHHPVCTCNHGLTGNPLVRCYPLQGLFTVYFGYFIHIKTQNNLKYTLRRSCFSYRPLNKYFNTTFLTKSVEPWLVHTCLQYVNNTDIIKLSQYWMIL